MAPATVPCQYKVGRILGQGTYAVVKEAVHITTGRFYACKVINKRLMEGRESMVRNEIAVLKKISVGHPNIVTLHDYFEACFRSTLTFDAKTHALLLELDHEQLQVHILTLTAGHIETGFDVAVYLVTDLCTGGELFDRICAKGSYFEKDARHLVHVITSAVAYLHSKGIVHRDLKPENLLFRTKDEDADLMIADFGLSKMIDDKTITVLTTTCGTVSYMAKELFKKEGHGKPVDIWAIGVITYFLLCGYTPFDRDSNQEEIKAICSADYAFEPVEYWEHVSESARDFIRYCLTLDQFQRPTAHQLLEHEWLRSDEVPGVVDPDMADGSFKNLLPNVRKGFNAKGTWKSAFTKIKAANTFKGLDSESRDIRMQVDAAQAEAESEEIAQGHQVMDSNSFDTSDTSSV